MKVINPNQLVLIMAVMVATIIAVIIIITPKLIGETAVKQEITSVIKVVLKSIKVMGYPYNKRFLL